MDKVRPWCGQPSDQGRLKNRTEQTQSVRLSRLQSSCTGGDVEVLAGVSLLDDELYQH